MLPDTSQLTELFELALALGADNAAILKADDILIEPELAQLCKETRCPNYGRSPNCPPNVKGPAWLKEYIKQTPFAIFIQIEMDRDQMYSDQRLEIGKLLHFIVIEIEKAAQSQGLDKAFGFAGGSCKELFCADHYTCEVLEGSGECRNPDSARPSVSGFGINTNHLLKIAGWKAPVIKDSTALTSSRYGLVLLG